MRGISLIVYVETSFTITSFTIQVVQAHSMPILCIGADLSRSVWTGRVTDVSFMGANLREAKFLEVRQRCSVIKHES